MRLGIVSTYPPFRCAIGLYSELLATSILARHPELTVRVVAEHGAAPSDDPRLRVVPTYSRNERYPAAVAGALAGQVDLAHFQYAPDLFGEDDRLPEVIERLARAGVRTVVTLHTVYGERPLRRLVGKATTGAFHRALAEHVDRIVVHHETGMADRLVSQGVPRSRIAVIPHGTVAVERRSATEARARLNLPADAFVMTFFGFIHRLKNVHTVVEAFLRLSARHPRAVLLVAGMPWGDRWYNRLYVAAMKARVQAAGRADRAQIRDEYVAPETVPDVYAATDLVLLPHQQEYGSASGVFHQAIGSGRPVMLARGPKFADGQRLLTAVPELVVDGGSVAAWRAALERVLDDPAIVERGLAAVNAYAAETSWPNVADRHVALYREILV